MFKWFWTTFSLGAPDPWETCSLTSFSASVSTLNQQIFTYFVKRRSFLSFCYHFNLKQTFKFGSYDYSAARSLSLVACSLTSQRSRMLMQKRPLLVYGITNHFLCPSNSKVYGKEPRYIETSFLRTTFASLWHFVISRFHCIKATLTLHEVISSGWGFVKVEEILVPNLRLSFGSCKCWPNMTRLGGWHFYTWHVFSRQQVLSLFLDHVNNDIPYKSFIKPLPPLK